MLPAGKLPLHFLFLTGFVVGLFAVYFGRGILLNRAGMLDEDTLYRMKYMTVDSSILFWYVLCKKMSEFSGAYYHGNDLSGMDFLRRSHRKIRILCGLFSEYGSV